MTIIHGDHQVASRSQLLILKQAAVESGKQVVEFSGGSLTLPELVNAAESVSLFGNANVVIIQDLFTRRQGIEKKVILEYLAAHPQSNIIIWESKDVSSQLKQFSPSSVKKFDLPKYLFKFLEDFSLAGLHQAAETTPVEQLFPLLVRQLHNLILTKENRGDFATWQKSKLTAQASRYSLKQLLAMYHRLLKIDYYQKTSTSPYNLTGALDLWIATL
jgi:DNA polymerase III delta subunit